MSEQSDSECSPAFTGVCAASGVQPVDLSAKPGNYPVTFT